MKKVITILSIILINLILAQSELLELPVTITGTGTQNTNSFIATNNFIVNIATTDNIEIYLFNKSTNLNIIEIKGGELLNYTGEYYLNIFSINPDVIWTLSIVYESGLYERPIPNPKTDLYNCTDFSSPAEAHAFFLAQGGPEYDPNNLDGNGNGIACEKGSDNAESDSSNLCPPGKHWVRPYTRTDGANVRGHCRKD